MTAILEPTWTDACTFRRQLCPLESHRWLNDEGSLTASVVAACEGEFSVRVLTQHRGRVACSEQRILSLARGQHALIREVQLCCTQVPWVFARTLIPFSSLSGRARSLAHLGNRPLGAVLFSDPSTVRRRIEFARLTARHRLYQSAATHLDARPKELWGRRTLYEYAHKPLLVNEIFLPEIASKI